MVGPWPGMSLEASQAGVRFQAVLDTGHGVRTRLYSTGREAKREFCRAAGWWYQDRQCCTWSVCKCVAV